MAKRDMDKIMGIVDTMVSQSATTQAIINRMAAEGVSRASAIRYTQKAREYLKKNPNPETPIQSAILTLSVGEYPKAPEVDPGKPSAKIMAAAADMEKVRKEAMFPGDNYDPRVAIGAATAEAQILIAAAKLAREMREASGDDISLHPQHARFREDLIKAIEGTDLELTIRQTVENFQGRAKL